MQNKIIGWTKNWAAQNNCPYQFFQSLQSSNITARTISIKEEKLLIISDQQTHPVGRNSRAWVPSDFMATWAWNQKNLVPHVTSIRVGLLFYHAFQSIWPSSDWALKPPNDIYYKNKKLSGFLLETVITDHNNQLILGVGINVLNSPIESATCLSDHFDVTKDLWENFLKIINKSLDHLKLNNSERLSSVEINQTLEFVKKHESFREIKSIDEDGNFILKDKVISWKDL